MSETSQRDVAVVGMAGRFPGARDLAELWRNLENGVEAVRRLTDEELLAAGVPRSVLERPDYVKAASSIEGAGELDAGFFGLTAREAELLDPQQRLFLEHVWTALEDAGYTPERFDGLVGIYAGVAWNTYLLSNLMTHRELFDGAGAFQVFITNDKDFMPTRVSYKLDLKGPSVIVQTSCSTSLVATHLACLALQSYECDLALAGGVTVKVPGAAGYFYEEGGLASPDGHCRSFDAAAAGTVFGSGVGVVVLKRLSEALEDGDAIRAVIRGSAINNDGSAKVSYTAPSVEGQAEVIAAAQEMAGVSPETIRYVECHGTATALGDPIEVRALTKVFRESTDRKGFCALGSVKSNVGHLDAAAGVAGLVKTVMALERRRIPPSLNFERPNPALELDSSPFYVASRLEEWTAAGGVPRRAGVSSFGVGGTNAHVVLEEAPERKAAGPSRPWQTLVLSARSAGALDRASENLRAFLETAPEEAGLADLAYTLRVGRRVFRHRRALTCRDRAEAVAVLAGRRPGRLRGAVDTGEPRRRPVAFLLSGQGSQYPGMAQGLYEAEAVFRDTVDRCAGKLEPALGTDLRRILWPPPDDEEAAARLGRTRFTQPALFVVEHALAALWKSWGVVPAALLGHSIGEYVAACLGATLSEDDALALVAERGRLMDELPGGAMLAVPFAEAEARELLEGHPELGLAAVNAPERCVISGTAAAVAACEARLGERGIEGRRLHTSHAFHSPMTEPVLESFTAAVGQVRLRAPEIPWISNVTGTWITAEEATDPAYWARQLRSPVRFADGVAILAGEAERVFLEVGPGRALATLARRHPSRREEQPVLTSLGHPRDGEDDAAHVAESLAGLWLAGVELDPDLLYAGERRRRVPLPTYPFERRRYWIEAGDAAPERAEPGPRQKPEIADWFYLPSWKPSLPPPAGGSAPPSSWLVLTSDEGPGAALAAKLREAGHRVTTAAPGGLSDLLEDLSAVAVLPEVIVHTWCLGGPGAKDAAAAQAAGFDSLLALARVLAARPDALPASGVDVLVVADGLCRVTDDEPLHPGKTLMLGLCRVLPQELPAVRCRMVDTACPGPGSEREAGLADRLLAEIAAPAGDEIVAYRGRQRWIEAFEPVRLEESGPEPLRERGVYLLTGGLAGNGYALARYMAKSADARLALLEPDEPGDTERRRIAALEELGAEVLVIAVPLTRAEEVGRAIAEAEERFGPLNGVLHTAGTVGQDTFRTLAEIDAEHLARHFGPKVHGTRVLAEALGARELPELDFCVLLSSLASVLGGLAYGAYAAANHFVDAFARSSSGLPWRSVGWDVWQLEDEEEQITALSADLAELAMTPRQGEEAFRRLLGAGADLLLVSTADLEARRAERRRRIEGRRGEGPARPAGARHPRPALGTPYVPPASDLERRIAEVWGEFLGIEGIGVDDNFFELGGDSFVAVRVAARLNQVLERKLPVAQLYQHLTVRSLAGLLAGDADRAAEERAEHLAERRDSMQRRGEALKRRRQRKKALAG